MSEAFFLVDKNGQSFGVRTLYPTTIVPGGEASATMFRAYGSRDWGVSSDKLPSPEPWLWRGKVQDVDRFGLRRFLSRLEVASKNAIKVVRDSDSAWLPLAGGGRPTGSVLSPTLVEITIMFYPKGDSWLIEESRAFGDGAFGEATFPEGIGTRRTY